MELMIWEGTEMYDSFFALFLDLAIILPTTDLASFFFYVDGFVFGGVVFIRKRLSFLSNQKTLLVKAVVVLMAFYY